MRSGCSWLPLMRYTNDTAGAVGPRRAARLEAPDEHTGDEGNSDYRRLIQHVDDVGGLSGGDAGADEDDRREQDPHRVLAKEALLIPRSCDSGAIQRDGGSCANSPDKRA